MNKQLEEAAKEYADGIQLEPDPNKSIYYTTGDHWDDLKEGFKAGAEWQSNNHPLPSVGDGWVNVEEKDKPGKNETVIACTFLEGKYQLLNEYVTFWDGKWYWSDGISKVRNKVTHWRKLPEPPNN